MKLGWMGKGILGGTGGIVTFRGTGGIFTLAGTGGILTLGGGGGAVRAAGYGGTLMGSVGFVMSLSNILESSTMACCWESPNWANGAAGVGLMRDFIRSCASTMAASTVEVFGTGHWCRKNFTVLAV